LTNPAVFGTHFRWPQQRWHVSDSSQSGHISPTTRPSANTLDAMRSVLAQRPLVRKICFLLGFGVPAIVLALPQAGAAWATDTHAAGAVASAGDHWLWPTPPPHRIMHEFRAPATRYSAGHRGIDIAAHAGEAVVAPAAGLVHFAGRVVDREVVTIDAGDGLLVSIEPVDAQVSLHDLVAAGSQIGIVARGGHCDDTCVHFGVRLHGEYVSPLLYLGGLERAVLLPMSTG
jgi:murein DD-endopeptidase MepM/ murein hydrolase activator NlpD